MGGGSEYELVNSVMPCPNAQLFDDSVQACSSTMTKCSTSGGVEEKPKTRSPSNRPTNKPMAQTSNTSRPPPPAPRQPIPTQSMPNNNIVDNNGEDWSTIPQSSNTPPRATPSPVRPPNEQAANAIVESAISNIVDNEGEEDWSSTPPLDVSIPSPTPPPLEWIGYVPENENTQSSSITQSTSSTEISPEKRCTTNKDCYNLPNKQHFCNQPTPYDIGYCGQCMIFNGMGCATDELCLIEQEGEGEGNICHKLQSGISNSQSIGITKCYKYIELDIDCQIMLNDSEAICNVEKMICVGGKKPVVMDSSVLSKNKKSRGVVHPQPKGKSIQSAIYVEIQTSIQSTLTR